MTPVQEVWNALSMVPVAMVAARAMASTWGIPALSTKLIAFGILLHFPFSFSYHVLCALHYGRRHPVHGNASVTLDLIFIQVAATLMAGATSRSATWFTLSVAYNGVCIYRLAGWKGGQFERRACRFGCAVLYMTPSLALDTWLFARTFAIFILAGFTFALNRLLDGWGHAISHLLLVPLAGCLLEAAAILDGL